MSNAVLRTSASTISRAMAPSSGRAMNSELRSIPILRAYSGSKAMSTSISAATPPRRWAASTACKRSVETPETQDPDLDDAAAGQATYADNRSSSVSPSGMTWTSEVAVAPSRWIEPWPNFSSILAIAAAT